MPTYQYECKGCGSSWEETHKIAERENPCKIPCRVCFDENQTSSPISIYGIHERWLEKTHGSRMEGSPKTNKKK